MDNSQAGKGFYPNVTAKEIEDIEAAKAFFWHHLQPHNKELLILMATKQSASDYGLTINHIYVGFQYK